MHRASLIPLKPLFGKQSNWKKFLDSIGSVRVGGNLIQGNAYRGSYSYLGSMVSTVDLIDEGIIRRSLVTPAQRDLLLEKAVGLANLLGPSFDSPTGMIWPRVCILAT